MLDAMAIKKHVQYSPHTQKMSGFVDMGDGMNETDVATEALVFMVVGLQGHWKASIAYYLTKSLKLQGGNSPKKLCRTVLFQGF
uniref:Transposable element P transposase-like RNase H domain-containing protein n=1 Tax=Anguilla anguilla TaxID=7936 RepID=A0A0E9XLZ2_ANGAN